MIRSAPSEEKPAAHSSSFPLMHLIRHALLLTLTSLFIRSVLLRFNLFLSRELGSASMGIMELILSVWSFALTFSTAGVNLASSRLTAEELGLGSGAGARAVMSRCLRYGLIMGGCAGAALLMGSEWIAARIGERDAAPALRLLAAGLPCVAASSAISGYFSAVRRSGKNAVTQLLEVTARVGITLILLQKFGGNRSRAYFCVVLGMTLSEWISFFHQFLLYTADQKRNVPRTGQVRTGLTKAILHVTLPIAFSSYIRSGLVTLEHMLIPYGLKRFGASQEESLAAYGMLSSVALPVLFFPASLLYAANGLLIPEIARAESAGDEGRITRISRRFLHFTLVFGIGTAAILLCFSRQLGDALSDDARVGEYLGLLAPLVPVMYLDSAADALLKGLSEQIYCMCVNIADAALSALLVFFLVPRFGIKGYIGVIILSELLNASLSVSRLSLRIDLHPRPVKWIAVPLLAAIGATAITNIAVTYAFPTGGIASTVIGILFCLLVYLGFVFLLGGLDAQS